MSDTLLNKTVDCPECGGNGRSDGGDCNRCRGCGEMYVCCGHATNAEHHDKYCENAEHEWARKRGRHTIAERLRWIGRGNRDQRNDASLEYAAQLLEGDDG